MGHALSSRCGDSRGARLSDRHRPRTPVRLRPCDGSTVFYLQLNQRRRAGSAFGSGLHAPLAAMTNVDRRRPLCCPQGCSTRVTRSGANQASRTSEDLNCTLRATTLVSSPMTSSCYRRCRHAQARPDEPAWRERIVASTYGFLKRTPEQRRSPAQPHVATCTEDGCCFEGRHLISETRGSVAATWDAALRARRWSGPACS